MDFFCFLLAPFFCRVSVVDCCTGWNCFVSSIAVCNMEAPHHDGRKQWSRCFHKKVRKIRFCIMVTDFRPVANIWVFHKVFAYLVFAKKIPTRSTTWVSFRPTHVTTRLTTTNLLLDTSRTAGLPLWIIRWDLSKALANAVRSFVSTKYFKSVDFDSAVL